VTDRVTVDQGKLQTVSLAQSQGQEQCRGEAYCPGHRQCQGQGRGECEGQRAANECQVDRPRHGRSGQATDSITRSKPRSRAMSR